MFRNLRLYRLTGDWPESEEALSSKLAIAEFEPCGSLAEQSAGWEAPTGDRGDPLCRRVGGADLLRLRLQTRLLTGAAVNEALEDRLLEFTTRTAREPSAKEKRQLKEEVRAKLIPRALLKSDRIHGFYLLEEKVIGIDTTSAPRAEQFLDRLRAALGSLPVTPLKFQQPVASLLTKVFLGDAPRAFRLGRECLMQDPAAGHASVNWLDVDLSNNDVRRHVKNGLKVNRVAVEFGEAFRCVMDADAVLRKLRLQGDDPIDDGIDEDPLARLDADFVLLTATIRSFLGQLTKTLGGMA